MLTNFLKDKCIIQSCSITHTALGDVETWDYGEDFWCRKISVDTQTRIAYMQKNTVITDRFMFHGELELRLGYHRIIYKGKTYELVESGQVIEGNTVVLTKEVIDG
jgi:hypothetical protein